MNRLDNEYLKRLEWKAMTDDDYKDKLKHVKNQIKSLSIAPLKTISCECGRAYLSDEMFRCLYCGERFCVKCAEFHFGKTREEYDRER